MPHRRLRNTVTLPSWAIVAGIIGLAAWAAAHPEPVYGPVEAFTISRRLDESGRDRVYISASVRKLENCDLESGDGPPWIDFYDPQDVGTPPPSALYRPSGEVAGSTRADAGEVVVMDGYSAIVPQKMREGGGSFSIRIPCQRWDFDAEGKRVWGRKVIATWGPAPLPSPGTTITDRPAGIPLGDLR